MRIGDISGQVEQSILDLGFPFTDELTVLGFTLRNDDTITELNFDKAKTKISVLEQIQSIYSWQNCDL